MSNFTAQELINAVQGDFDALSLLLCQRQDTLIKCRSSLDTLIVTPAAVKRVLLALMSGRVPPALVQQWASFVRRGYIGSYPGKPVIERGPIQTIDIDYDPNFEGAIAEIISRLDEIGDLIDGVATDNEILLMLKELSAPEMSK